MRNSNRNILIIILCLFFVSGCFLFLLKRNTAQISSPDISEDKRLPGGYRSTWDCVFFGEYPRSEVSQSEAFDKAEWTDDEALIDGKRYKRVKTKTGCRYFIYEPLKWRIIEKMTIRLFFWRIRSSIAHRIIMKQLMSAGKTVI